MVPNWNGTTWAARTDLNRQLISSEDTVTNLFTYVTPSFTGNERRSHYRATGVCPSCAGSVSVADFDTNEYLARYTSYHTLYEQTALSMFASNNITSPILGIIFTTTAVLETSTRYPSTPTQMRQLVSRIMLLGRMLYGTLRHL